MPGGHRKKKVVKHNGKKNKTIRSQSIKHKEECIEKEEVEEVKEITQSFEGSEKAEEDVQATTNADFLMEETETTTQLLDTHEDEPILQSSLSPHIDHDDEDVMKNQNMLIEQLTAKIEPLTKQLEQLTTQSKQLVTEVGKYKARCSELEEELRSVSAAKQQDQEDVQNQLRLLNQKFASSNTKLCESRNQCQQLKQELKLVHKALANEVGDSVCVQEIVSGASNWRGRAQQILMLQQKVSELQNQLQEINGKDLSQTVMENAVAKSKSAQTLKQLEKERRAMQENVVKQLQEKTIENEEIQKKFEGIRARNRVLEGDMVNLKSTIGTLLEKGKHDDQLISALTFETKRLESKLREYQESEKIKACQWEDERQKHKKEIAQEKSKSSQMQSIIKQKDEELRQLEEKLVQLKEQEIFSSSCLQEQSDSHPLNDFRDRMHDSSCAESKNKDPDQFQKSYLAAEAECTRLLELIAVLNKRLDEYRHKADEAEERLQCERQKCARLETKVAHLESEKSVAFKSTYSFRTSKQPAQKPTAIPEEVQDRLEFLQEQNITLQTRLKRLKQEKSEDLKMFTKVLSSRQQHFPVQKKISK